MIREFRDEPTQGEKMKSPIGSIIARVFLSVLVASLSTTPARAGNEDNEVKKGPSH